MNDLLPVGSVVFLYNNKKCMIIGYSPNKNNSSDYEIIDTANQFIDESNKYDNKRHR